MSKRILLLDTGKEWGGGTNSMFELLKRIDRTQFDVTALFELANNRGTHHSAMTGDKNTLFCHSQDSSAMATS